MALLDRLLKMLEDDTSSFYQAIEKFCVSHCDDVPDSDLYPRCSSFDPINTYSITITELHNRFVRLAEDLLQDFIVDNDSTIHEMYSQIRDKLKDEGRSECERNRQSSEERFMRTLEATIDFDTFVAMLAQAKEEGGIV